MSKFNAQYSGQPPMPDVEPLLYSFGMISELEPPVLSSPLCFCHEDGIWASASASFDQRLLKSTVLKYRSPKLHAHEGYVGHQCVDF